MVLQLIFFRLGRLYQVVGKVEVVTWAILRNTNSGGTPVFNILTRRVRVESSQENYGRVESTLTLTRESQLEPNSNSTNTDHELYLHGHIPHFLLEYHHMHISYYTHVGV